MAKNRTPRSISMDNGLLEAVIGVSNRTGISISELVNRALAMHLPKMDRELQDSFWKPKPLHERLNDAADGCEKEENDQ